MRFSEWKLLRESTNVAGLVSAVLDSQFDQHKILILADALEDEGDPLAQLLRTAIAVYDRDADGNSVADASRKYEEFLKVAQQLRSSGSFGNIDFSLWNNTFEFDYKTKRMKEPKRVTAFVNHDGVSIKNKSEWISLPIDTLPKSVLRATIFMIANELEKHSVSRANDDDELPFQEKLLVRKLWSGLQEIYGALMTHQNIASLEKAFRNMENTMRQSQGIRIPESHTRDLITALNGYFNYLNPGFEANMVRRGVDLDGYRKRAASIVSQLGAR